MTEQEIDNKCFELLKCEESIDIYTSKTLVYSTLFSISSAIALVSFFNMTETTDNYIMYGLAGGVNTGLSLYELNKIIDSLIKRKKSIEKFDEVLEELDAATGRLR